MPYFDTILLGAGAAGLFCGARSAARGHSVLVLDHARKPAEKVRISGGGRCNFTNLECAPDRFISENPHFAKSALARYTPSDFCELMTSHGLTWHEKTLGQLFCDQKSGAVIAMLLRELEGAGGQLRLETEIGEIRHTGKVFEVATSQDQYSCAKLVIATGGLSIPKMGASDFAYRIARQFGHDIVATGPALVPFTFSGALQAHFSDLSGVATPTRCSANSGPAFDENLLFTHRGLSGPSMLQISSYWNETEAIRINLMPGIDVEPMLAQARIDTPKHTAATALATYLPTRLAQKLQQLTHLPFDKRLAELSKREMSKITECLQNWHCKPTGTEGWRTAEVTRGGVATRALSSRNMESQIQPGLYFIGECVDVTGWLGGYNFQWAWASAAAAGDD